MQLFYRLALLKTTVTLHCTDLGYVYTLCAVKFDVLLYSNTFVQRPGSKNVQHIHAPTEVLHISNIP